MKMKTTEIVIKIFTFEAFNSPIKHFTAGGDTGRLQHHIHFIGKKSWHKFNLSQKLSLSTEFFADKYAGGMSLGDQFISGIQ